jgi:tetratricopeptide (TPR) repeat protein
MISRFITPARSNFEILAIVAIVCLSLFAHSQVQSPGELHGKVCDRSGKPIASATVTLQAQGAPNSYRAQTNPDGIFSFSSLPSGNYNLEVSAPGFARTNFSAISIMAEVKTFDVILRAENVSGSTPSASTAPQFFDQPQFTVSGVTDTTNMGGHGSGPITHNREAVEKDVRSLSGNPQHSSGASSDAYDLAFSYANAGEYERARSQLQTLPAQHATAEAHHLLAMVDEKLGDSLEAVDEYERAAELDPSESNIFDWGSELLLHHAPEPAIEVFTKGKHLFPGSNRMLTGLGSAEFAAGSNERAIQNLCAASDLHPEDPIPYLFLGKVQRSENTVSAEVVERFQRFASLRPDNADANYLYAAALWKQNQPNPPDALVARAESLVTTALRLNPKFADAHLLLGILHAQKQNPEAIIDFQHAIENQSTLEEAHYRLSRAYRAAGRIEDAKKEIAVYEQLRKQSAQETEREHHEIKQFVYSLRNAPATQVQ